MKKSRKFIASALIFLMMFVLLLDSLVIYADSKDEESKAVRAELDNGREYKEDELIIKFKDGMDSSQIKAFASQNELKPKKNLDKLNMHVFNVKRGTSVKSTMKKLIKNENIEYVQPNYVYHATDIPQINDIDYDKLWGLNNSNVRDVDIDAPEAWGITQGSGDVVVAVIDTGVDIEHPDLKDRIWTNEGEVPGNGEDDDENGYVDDVHGWDFYNEDNTLFDYYDGDIHGTHVAGTIAATANSIGVIGVAPNIRIMPLKFMGYDGIGYTSDAIRAIEYAADMGVRISNNSWGGPPAENEEVDYALMDAIYYAEENSDMLFVAAAGNDGKDIDIEGNEFYPAAFGNDNILTVAAVNSSGNLEYYSNYGWESVDVAAPGTYIYSTVPTVLGGGATVFASGENGYNSIISTFGLEDLSQENASELMGVMLGDVLKLDAASSKILLVDDDDDTNTVCEDVYGSYSTALTANAFVNIDTVEISSGSADLSESYNLGDYDGVIWFTGEAYSSNGVNPLTDNDTVKLASYLGADGKLVLFGEDILDGIEYSELVSDYLKVEVVRPDYGIWDENNGYANPSVESSGNITFESIPYELGDSLFRDHIQAIDGAEEILSYTENLDTYKYLYGTSMAAPHVSGIAALLLSKNPDQNYDDLKSVIMDTGEYDYDIQDISSENSIVNAYNALTAIAPEKPKNLTAAKEGSNIVLNWQNVNAPDLDHYVVERSIDGGTYTEIGNPSVNTYTDIGFDLKKTYRYKVKAVDKNGKESRYSDEKVGNSAVADIPQNNSNPSSGGSRRSSGGGGGGGGSSSRVDSQAPTPETFDDKVRSALKNNPSTDAIVLSRERSNSGETVALKVSTIAELNKSGKSLVLTGTGVDITIPAGALQIEELNKYWSSNTAKLYIKVQRLSGKEEQKATIGGNIYDFTIELRAEKDPINISKFNKKFEMSFKLANKDIEGLDVNKLGIYYYNDDSKSWEYAGGMIDAESFRIFFSTSHFSKYAVMNYDKTYKDISNHWAKQDIELLAAKNILEGINDEVFGPDINITRAEATKMLVNLLRYSPDRRLELVKPEKPTFTDVGANDPNFTYIETAAKEGIIKGSNGVFGPKDSITREQLITMIIRAMGIESSSDASILSFKDKDRIPVWAAKSVAAAYEKGIILGGSNSEFGVGSNATRAQAAAMVKRVMEKMGLMQVPDTIVGKLVMSEIEAKHYELETKDGIYVLLADSNDKLLFKQMSNLVGRNIIVTGNHFTGMTIYQRGKTFKVVSVKEQ